jgi:hypothetical protein
MAYISLHHTKGAAILCLVLAGGHKVAAAIESLRTGHMHWQILQRIYCRTGINQAPLLSLATVARRTHCAEEFVTSVLATCIGIERIEDIVFFVLVVSVHERVTSQDVMQLGVFDFVNLANAVSGTPLSLVFEIEPVSVAESSELIPMHVEEQLAQMPVSCWLSQTANKWVTLVDIVDTVQLFKLARDTRQTTGDLAEGGWN